MRLNILKKDLKIQQFENPDVRGSYHYKFLFFIQHILLIFFQIRMETTVSIIDQETNANCKARYILK